MNTTTELIKAISLKTLVFILRLFACFFVILVFISAIVTIVAAFLAIPALIVFIINNVSFLLGFDLNIEYTVPIVGGIIIILWMISGLWRDYD